MKWNFAIPPISMLLLFPLVSYGQDKIGTQESRDKPVVVDPAPAVEPIGTNTSPQSPDQQRESMRAHFHLCDQTLDQARDQAHRLSRDASQRAFDTDSLGDQHRQLQEKLRNLKGSHEQFLGDLTNEQQKSVQDHNQSMQQIHDRIQAHLQAIDDEFTGSNLHLKVVADEAKAAEREMKSYHKHLQETGKIFNLLAE